MVSLPPPVWVTGKVPSTTRTSRTNPIAWDDGKVVTNKQRAVKEFLQRKMERGEKLTEQQIVMLRLSRQRSASTGDVALTKKQVGDAPEEIVTTLGAVKHVEAVVSRAIRGMGGGGGKKRKRGKQGNGARRTGRKARKFDAVPKSIESRLGAALSTSRVMTTSRKGGAGAKGRASWTAGRKKGARGRGGGAAKGGGLDARLSASLSSRR